MSDYKYLGTAIRYPYQLVDGKGVIVSGKEVIKNSIIMILTTPVGTRMLLCEYGSKLHELHFEPNDEILGRLLRVYTLDALSKWETRAKFIDVEVYVGLDVAVCKIRYKILASNEVDSFIYPFYRNKPLAA